MLTRGRPSLSFTKAVTSAGVAAVISIALAVKLMVDLLPAITPSPAIVTPNEAWTTSTPTTSAYTKPAPAIFKVLSLILALPLASVSTEPISGSNNPNATLLKLNCTNLLAKALPSAASNVAVTVAGVAALILVVVELSVSLGGGTCPTALPSPFM